MCTTRWLQGQHTCEKSAKSDRFICLFLSSCFLSFFAVLQVRRAHSRWKASSTVFISFSLQSVGFLGEERMIPFERNVWFYFWCLQAPSWNGEAYNYTLRYTAVGDHSKEVHSVVLDLHRTNYSYNLPVDDLGQLLTVSFRLVARNEVGVSISPQVVCNLARRTSTPEGACLRELWGAEKQTQS